jgi:hypothetical protein
VIVDSPQLLRDGVTTLEQGMSSGHAPTLIAQQQCAYALNTTMRGGYGKNRPAFRQLTLTPSAAEAAWVAANFQGVGFYDIGDGQQHMIGMASGRLYQLDLVGNEVSFTDLTIDALNSPIRPIAYFCQADVYMVVQDGFATPLIMQGVTTVRRATNTEVPVGRSMAFGQGRLWLASGRNLQAGDIYGGPTSVVSFTEGTYLSEAKGGFLVPLQAGDIVGVAFLEVGDTSTGQGDLLVFCRKAVWSVQAGVPRTSWQTTPRMLSISLTNIGGTSHRAIVDVNGDCYFRAKDGWRSYRVARNEQFYSQYGMAWGYTPMSLEMKRVIDNDTVSLLDYGGAVQFKNRMLGLASPQTYQTPVPSVGTFEGVYFRSIVALDFDIVSGMRQKQPPAWDGEWLGLNVLQLLANDFTFVERCVAFVRNTTTGHNEIWEITDENFYDANQAPIQSVIETKTLDCQKPKNLKMLRRGDLYFTNVLAQTDVEIQYRSDGYPNWIPWHKFSINSQGHQLPGNPGGALCNIPQCTVPGTCAAPGVGAQGGYWFQQPLPTPDTICDPTVNKLLRNGFEFQFQISWIGPATLHALVIDCNEQIENPNGGPVGQRICPPPAPPVLPGPLAPAS